MTLHRYVQIVRRRWGLVVAGILLGLLVAVAVTARATPLYEASTKLFVATSTKDRTGSELANSSTFAQERVKSYAQLVTTAAVLSGVIETLELDVDLEHFAESVSAEVPLNTVVLEILVTMESPDQAAEVADAIAAALPAAVDKMENPRGAKTAPTALTVMEPAGVPRSPVSPRPYLNLVAGGIVGLIVGFGAGLVAHARDRKLRSVADIEEATGLPVLGIVVEADGDEDSEAGDRGDAVVHNSLRLTWASVATVLGGGPQVLVLAAISENPAVPKLTRRLAPALAETERDIVIVDTDLQRARTSAAFDVDGAPGLSDILGGAAFVEDCLARWRESQLSLLPAGSKRLDVTRLLSGALMASNVELLRGRFATVVLDATAAASTAELAVLGGLADAVVVVATPRARRDELTRSVSVLQASGLRIAGIVVDGVRERHLADFERRHRADDDSISTT